MDTFELHQNLYKPRNRWNGVTTYHLKIPTKDRLALSGLLFEPVKPKAAILFNSGTGVPKEVYSRMCKWLAQQGYAVLLYDYRGIGGSRPRKMSKLDCNVLDWMRLDMNSAADWLWHRHRGIPKAIIAHSLGGQFFGLLDQHEIVDKAICIGVATGSWRKFPAPYKYFCAAIWYAFIPITTSLFGYGPASWIRQGEDLPSGVARQWARWAKRDDYFTRDLDKAIAPHYFNEVKFPVTSILTTDDPIANPRTSRDIWEAYPKIEPKYIDIDPKRVGLASLGHFGFFSRRSKEKLWPLLIEEFNHLQ